MPDVTTSSSIPPTDIGRTLDRLDGGLTSLEIWWCDLQPWLEEKGYRLRPRYRPGWVPSWHNKKGLRWEACEDGQRIIRGYLMDATRISDNAPVLLKAVTEGHNTGEIPNGQFFSSEPLKTDTRNHCIPLYEVLEVPDANPKNFLLVTPLMRKFDDPPFITVEEAVEFFRQIIEGIQYMHMHNVAHRDCCAQNVMMDARGLYPDGFHPIETSKTLDFSAPARCFTRTERPPKYWLIDLGIAKRYAPDERPPSEPIVRGGDKSPPEHRTPDIPCDPFPTDVYYIGNLIKEEFLYKRRGFTFMRQLVADMVQEDPSKRPTIDAVAARFLEIRANLSSRTLRSRPAFKNEFFISSAVRDVLHWKRQFGQGRHTPPVLVGSGLPSKAT